MVVLQVDVNSAETCARVLLHELMHVCKCECMLVSGGCGFYYLSICHNLPTKPQPFEKNSIHYSVTTKSDWLLNLTCACSFIQFVVCVFSFSRAVTLAILTCAAAPNFQRYQTLESSSKNIFTNFHIRHSSFTIITF